MADEQAGPRRYCGCFGPVCCWSIGFSGSGAMGCLYLYAVEVVTVAKNRMTAMMSKPIASGQYITAPAFFFPLYHAPAPAFIFPLESGNLFIGKIRVFQQRVGWVKKP
ncbi:hypothetical protein [Geobacillus subterraneus]|uniref:hypothetical protein n=1 Tax=Geobacillus subterraneus TaxID=129338 RepID=UPI003D7ADF1A